MLPFFDHSYSKPCSAEFHTFSLQVISSSNLTLYPKKLQLVDAVTKVISFTKPFAVCCSCGKILYPSQVHWLKNVDEILWRARSFISPSSSLKIEKKWFESIDTISSCYECFTKLSKSQNFYLFDDLSEIPDCVKSLKSYNEYRKLAIGSLFCSTFKPPCYTYLHSVGDIWFNKDPRVFRGMVGLLYEGQNKELSTTSTDLKKVLMWLQKNNKLYKECFSNFETIIGHFEPLSASSFFASVPSFTKDLTIAKGGQLSVVDLEKQEGLLFPADKFISPVEPTNT